MTTKEILIAARKKIEQGWCQHAHALDRRNIRREPTDSKARRWCALGAVAAVAHHDNEGLRAVRAVQRVVKRRGECGLSFWNDARNRTQADVLAAFDKAIEACR